MGITTLYRCLIALLLFITLGSANAQSPNYQLPYYVRANWFSIRWTVPVVSYDSVYVKGLNGWMATAPRTVWSNLPGKPTVFRSSIDSVVGLSNTLSLYRTKSQNDGLYYPISSNPNGYLTSFTEVDPTVSAYAKSLSSFAVIKSSTDLLYKPISYTPTKSDVGLGNVLNVDQTNPANIVQSSSYRFVSDAEKASWSGKQDALGYVPVTPTQLTTGLATKENTVTAGTTSQYYRGDKTWQTLPTSIRVYVSAVTVGQSRAQLNTSYPTANIGDMVLAPSITLGGAIYVKSSTTGGGTWQIISAPPVL